MKPVPLAVLLARLQAIEDGYRKQMQDHERTGPAYDVERAAENAMKASVVAECATAITQAVSGDVYMDELIVKRHGQRAIRFRRALAISPRLRRNKDSGKRLQDAVMLVWDEGSFTTYLVSEFEKAVREFTRTVKARPDQPKRRGRYEAQNDELL